GGQLVVGVVRVGRRQRLAARSVRLRQPIAYQVVGVLVSVATVAWGTRDGHCFLRQPLERVVGPSLGYGTRAVCLGNSSSKAVGFECIHITRRHGASKLVGDTLQPIQLVVCIVGFRSVGVGYMVNVANRGVEIVRDQRRT